MAVPAQAPDREKIAEESATWDEWWSGGGSNSYISVCFNCRFRRQTSQIPLEVPRPSTLLPLDGRGLPEDLLLDVFPMLDLLKKRSLRETRGGSLAGERLISKIKRLLSQCE